MMTSPKITSAPRGSTRPWLMLVAVAVSWLLPAVPARATILAFYYTNSDNAAIYFGASPFSGSSTSPTWAYNSLTGLNDILASAGSGFPVANPVLGNNVASAGPSSLVGYMDALFLHQSGGTAPLSGASFGTGGAAIFGYSGGMYLTDSGGGGTASYGIETWTGHYTQNAGFFGYFGTYLSVGGSVSATGSVAIAALQAEVSVTSTTGTTNNYTLAPLILAVENLGGGNFATVTLSQNNNAESGAFVYVDPSTGQFWAFADDATLTNDFGAGSSITVTSTTTFYGDPASIQTIAPDTSLFPNLYVPTESFSYASPFAPGTLMGCTAIVVLSIAGTLRRRAA
jgi:hypothetical protein